MRIARLFVLAAAVVLIPIAAAFVWILGTNSGARWIFEQIPRVAPVALKAESIQGTLAGTLAIAGLDAAWPGGTVRIRESRMRWQPFALLSGRVEVSEFRVSGVHMRDNRPEGPPTQTGFSWPTTGVSLPPLLFRIRTLVLDDIVYQRRDRPAVRIIRSRADLLLTPETLSLRNMSLQMPQFTIQGAASAGLRESRLKADLKLMLGDALFGMEQINVRTNLHPAERPAVVSGYVHAQAFANSVRTFDFNTSITLSNQLLRLEDTILSQAGRPGRLTGRGEVLFVRDTPSFEGTVVLHDLDVAKEVPLLGRIDGSIRIKGSIEEYKGSLSLISNGQGARSANLESDFKGNSRSLDIVRLKAGLLAGSVSGSGHAQWGEKRFFSAMLKARGIQPGLVMPDWSGSLNLNAAGELQMTGKEQPRASVSIRLLDSSLKGQRISGSSRAGFRKGRTRLEHLTISGDSFLVSARGDLSERLDFSVRVDDLALFREGAEGKAKAQGWLRKRDSEFTGSIEARGAGLSLNGFRAGTVEIAARVEQAQDPRFSVRVIGRDCAYNAVMADNVFIESSGSLAEHRIEATLRSSVASLTTAVAGSYKNSVWNGTINQLSGKDKSGAWEAREQASVTIAANRFSLSPLTIQGGPGERINVRAEGGTDPLTGMFLLEWNGLNISRVNAWIKEIDLRGTASGRLSGKIDQESRIDLTGDASLSGGRIIRRIQGLDLKADIKKADLAVTWKNQSLNGSAILVLEQYGQLKAEFQFPLPARLPVSINQKGPIHASLAGQVRETGILSLLFPGLVQESRGNVELDVRAGGTWQSPEITGSAKLNNTAAYFPAAGIHVSDIEGNAVIEKNVLRVTSFKAVSGPGTIQGKGQIVLEGFRPVRYEGTLKGERFQALFLPHVRMLVSPDIEFHGSVQKLVARGSVRVPELLIYGTPKESSLVASEDVIIVGAEQEESKASRLLMDIEIKVILGDRIIVKTEGVDAKLGGEVVVTARSLNEVTGKGEIKVIKGKYSIYGVSLSIERGRLFFAGGPVANPTMDILAIKTVSEVKAGVQISGTLKKPLVKLYSEPGMPDADVLAYIVLGHPLGQDKEQGTLLMKAAGALLSAGQSIALQDQIKNRLGIDTIDIEAGGGEVARSLVTIGKYLSSRLYISYGYALFTGESLFKLRYKFGRNWELESHSGQASGVDLYYTVQFD